MSTTPHEMSPGFLGRIGAYLSEMYPLPRRLVGAAMIFAAVSISLHRLNAVPLELASYWSALGIWSVFALLLILRIMDEFKDRDIDEQLFRDRPLPSGRVKESDLTFALVAVCVLFVAAHVPAGPALWSGLVVLGYAFLMFRFFFFPDQMRRSLPLALVTHNPIIPLMVLHLVVIFSVQAALSLGDLNWMPVGLLVLMIWAPGFAWEIARKIRSPEEEDAYVTYSQLLGRRGAVALAAGAQAVSFLIGGYFAAVSLVSFWLPVIQLTGFVMVLWAHLRFLRNPSPLTSKLGPYAETYMTFVLAALIVGGLVP